MQSKVEHIPVFGIQLEVLRIPVPAGSARCAPIVFLHEGLGSVAMWQGKTGSHGGYWPAQVCAALGRPGIVYSRQGYGQSDPVPDVRGPSREANGQRQGRLRADYMHREAYEILPELLRLLGAERPLLLGHSDGASIALLHASRFDVEACIAMAPHVMVEDISLRAIEQIRRDYEQPASKLRERLARYHADVDCAFWQWNEVWLSEAFRSFDIRADCARITAPVLAIQGCDDAYGTMEQVDAIARALSGANFKKNNPEPAMDGRIVLQKLEHCGHSPHKDQAELVLGIMKATFL